MSATEIIENLQDAGWSTSRSKRELFAIRDGVMVCLGINGGAGYVSGEFRVMLTVQPTPERVSLAITLVTTLGPRLREIRTRHTAHLDGCYADGISVCSNEMAYGLMLDGSTYLFEGSEPKRITDTEVGIMPHPTDADQCEAALDDSTLMDPQTGPARADPLPIQTPPFQTVTFPG